VTYHAGHGALLEQTLRVNDQVAPLRAPLRVRGNPASTQFRVKPGLQQFEFVAVLSHADVVRKRVTTRVQDTGCAPTQGCAETRTEERDQWVTLLIQDSRCDEWLDEPLAAGGSYILKIDYLSPGKCTLEIVK